MKIRKIIRCQVILLSVLFISLSISKNVYADKINEMTTEEIVSTTATTTTDVASQKKLPKAVTKFVKKKMKLKSVTLLSKTSMQLSWKKVSGADGYIIYREEKGGKIKRIKKIKDQKQTDYIDKKVKYGKVYTYTIKAYKKYKGKTYYSNYVKKGIKKKLKVKNKYKNGYKYFYDMDNNRIKNVEPFLGKTSYCLKVNLTSSVMTVYAKDGKKGYTIPVKAYLCSGNTWDPTDPTMKNKCKKSGCKHKKI